VCVCGGGGGTGGRVGGGARGVWGGEGEGYHLGGVVLKKQNTNRNKGGAWGGKSV